MDRFYILVELSLEDDDKQSCDGLWYLFDSIHVDILECTKKGNTFL